MAEQQRTEKTYLPASAYDPSEFDTKEHAECFAAYSDATDSSEAEVDGCYVRYLQAKNGYREIDLRNVKAVESMLETTTAKSTSTFIAIAPLFSERHLVYREAFLKILSFFAVLPAFSRILHTFYLNEGGTSGSGFYSQHCNLPQNTDEEKVSYELCFSLRDVEKKKEKISARQVGAWMSYHPVHNKSAWIFVNASDGFLMRLKDLTQSDSANDIKQSDIKTIQLLLSSVLENWSDCLDHLEQKYEGHRRSAILSMFSRVTDRDPPIKYVPQLEQQLAGLEEPCNSLKMNHHVITSMKLDFEKFRLLSAENADKLAQDTEFVEVAALLDNYLLQTANHQEHISALKNEHCSVITRILGYKTPQEKDFPMEVEREKEVQFSVVAVIAVVACASLAFMVCLFNIEFLKKPSQGRFMHGTPAFLALALAMLAAAMGSWFGCKKCTGRGRKSDIETGTLKVRKPIVLLAGGTAGMTTKRGPVGSHENHRRALAR